MDEKKIFMGLGGLALILLLVAVFMSRDSGPDLKGMIAKEVGPISVAVADLGSRVDGVEGSLGEISAQLANAATTEDVAAVTAQVEEAMAQTGTLSESIAAMQTTLDDTVEAVKSAPASVAVASAPEGTAPAPQDTAVAEDGAPGFKPGETAVFADGALRMFVSRLDAEAQAVRVSVGGEMKTLAVGQGRTMAVADDFCRVTVSSVSGNGAAMDAVCGDDLPVPEGISAGETSVFADGALRVFASRVLEDEARLSVNGEMQTLAIGRSVPVMAGDENCRVYLDALDRGHALVSTKCGADVTVSEVAGPGSTVLLSDGAVRVFVGSVMNETVRFSVNGQTLLTGTSGDSHGVGEGCAVTVEDVAEGKASFSHSCEG